MKIASRKGQAMEEKLVDRPALADFSVGLFVGELFLRGSRDYRSLVRVDGSKRSPATDDDKIDMVCKCLWSGRNNQNHRS